MKYYEKRNEDPKEVGSLTVIIGENKYRLTETVGGLLGIHKSTTSEIEEIAVFPRVTNVINIQ